MTVLRIRSHCRYAVRSEAKLRTKGRRSSDCLLIELSQDGARISKLGSLCLDVGDEVVLATDHADPITATVRWSNGGRAGLRLKQPLHPSELSQIIESDRRNDTPTAKVA